MGFYAGNAFLVSNSVIFNLVAKCHGQEGYGALEMKCN